MHSPTRARRAAAAAAAAAAAVLIAAAPVSAQSAEPALGVSATIDGRDLARVDANEPLRLDPDREAVVRLVVTNLGKREVTIRTVRLDGRVLGLAFFSFATRTDLAVPAGGTGRAEFPVELADLRGQAVGLVPGRLSLLGPDRTRVAALTFATDVRGSALSVYGVFGAAVAGITGLLLVGALVRLATHRLPRNRWYRGTCFGVPGTGVGLTATFTLSAFGVVSPSPSTWVPLVLGGGVVGFVAGYLTPGPADDEEELDVAVGGADVVVDLRDAAPALPAFVSAATGLPESGLEAPGAGARTTLRRVGPPPRPGP